MRQFTGTLNAFRSENHKFGGMQMSRNSVMAQVERSDERSRTGRSPTPTGLYTGLVRIAGVCGVATGVARIVDARDNMLFIPALVFSILVPIGCGAGLVALGLAASRGSRVSFYATWLLAGVLLIPVSIELFIFSS